MIVTAIVLFLMGTGVKAASLTEVDYKSPFDINIKEFKNDTMLPVSSNKEASFMSNLIHQGSNYFFNPHILLSPMSYVPSYGTVVVSHTPEKNESTNTTEKPKVPNCPNEPEIIPPLPDLPLLVVPELPNETIVPEPFEEPEIPPFPIEPVNDEYTPMEIPPPPELPPLIMPDIPPVVPIIPCDNNKEDKPQPDIIVPEFPPLDSSDVPIIIVEPDRIKIPSPPVLPPLVMPELPSPIFDDDKTVVLVPALPELPSTPIDNDIIYVEKTPDLPVPTACARDIILERVLPNIVYEKTTTVEVISIPAATRIPIESKSFIGKLLNDLKRKINIKK